MNKFFIGYQLPPDATQVITELMTSIMGGAHLKDAHQLHVTALYLGPQVKEVVDVLFDDFVRPREPLFVRFDEYDRFGKDSLVIKLRKHTVLDFVHGQLVRLAQQRLNMMVVGSTFAYNPHITIASGSRSAFPSVSCPSLQFTLDSITLFEKEKGGEYQIRKVRSFYEPIH